MTERDSELIVDGHYVDRLDDETGQPISVTEWAAWEWEEVTGLGDSGRRYHRVRRLDPPR